MAMTSSTQWLLESEEPWTRYRTLVDLLDRPEDDPEAQAARAEMLAHPQVQAMIADTATWGDRPIKRHNDAGHPIYKFSTLADLGVRAADASIPASIETVMAHQSPEGAFQSRVNVQVIRRDRRGHVVVDVVRRADACSTPCWPLAWVTTRACSGR